MKGRCQYEQEKINEKNLSKVSGGAPPMPSNPQKGAKSPGDNQDIAHTNIYHIIEELINGTGNETS